MQWLVYCGLKISFMMMEDIPEKKPIVFNFFQVQLLAFLC